MIRTAEFPVRISAGRPFGEVVTARNIRTPEVERASKMLMNAVEQAALNCDLSPDLVEGQLSGLMGSLWL
jgi:hypothetical protein